MSIEKYLEQQMRMQRAMGLEKGILNSSWLKNIERIGKIASSNMLFEQKGVFIQSSKLYSQVFFEIDKLLEHVPPLPPVSVTKNIGLVKARMDAFFFKEYDFSHVIQEYGEEVKEESEKPKIILLNETERIIRIIQSIYGDNHRLLELHHRDFEKMIAELLYSQGFEVELSKQTRDGGYDILALKYINGLSPIKYLVECKRFAEKRKVGVGIVRSFKEVIQTEHANKGIICTTSYFSKDAIKKQKETPLLLDYKNKDEIIEWVNAYMTRR